MQAADLEHDVDRSVLTPCDILIKAHYHAVCLFGIDDHGWNLCLPKQAEGFDPSFAANQIIAFRPSSAESISASLSLALRAVIMALAVSKSAASTTAVKLPDARIQVSGSFRTRFFLSLNDTRFPVRRRIYRDQAKGIPCYESGRFCRNTLK